MGRSVADVELACRVLFGKSSSPSEWLPPVPYKDAQLPQKLKFGYYKSGELSELEYILFRQLISRYLLDIFMKACPAVQRAVQETVDALRAKGHECVEIEIPFSKCTGRA
jgi:Asp-tRNA(Asn)/Glu-tRNA(Gln) amidotransferase A subunit family amidase